MAPSVASFADLLVSAVNDPGVISLAYRQFHNYSLGNQLLAWSQCLERGIQPGPMATFPKWKDLGRYVRKGDELLRELRNSATTTYVSPISFATALVARGDHDDALTWLERAVDERTPALVYLNTHWFWDPLRSDPRFEALTKRLGLPTVVRTG